MKRNDLKSTSSIVPVSSALPWSGNAWSTVTANVAADAHKDPISFDGIREILAVMAERATEPARIIVDEGFPDGLTIAVGDLRFMTLSEDGLLRLLADASTMTHRASSAPAFSSILGLPIVRLADLEAAENPNGRRLAETYRAAVRGYVRGLES